MDHLWRHTKRQTVGNRATLSIEESTLHACQYILDLDRATVFAKRGFSRETSG